MDKSDKMEFSEIAFWAVVGVGAVTRYFGWIEWDEIWRIIVIILEDVDGVLVCLKRLRKIYLCYFRTSCSFVSSFCKKN